MENLWTSDFLACSRLSASRWIDEMFAQNVCLFAISSKSVGFDIAAWPGHVDLMCLSLLFDLSGSFNGNTKKSDSWSDFSVELVSAWLKRGWVKASWYILICFVAFSSHLRPKLAGWLLSLSCLGFCRCSRRLWAQSKDQHKSITKPQSTHEKPRSHAMPCSKDKWIGQGREKFRNTKDWQPGRLMLQSSQATRIFILVSRKGCNMRYIGLNLQTVHITPNRCEFWKTVARIQSTQQYDQEPLKQHTFSCFEMFWRVVVFFAILAILSSG